MEFFLNESGVIGWDLLAPDKGVEFHCVTARVISASRQCHSTKKHADGVLFCARRAP
jgi:hypothetical protein